MSRRAQYARLGVALAILTAGGFALGESIGSPAADAGNEPAAAASAPHKHGTASGAVHNSHHDHEAHAHGKGAPQVLGDGTTRSAGGYSLSTPKWTGGRLTFRVLNDAGRVETQFATTHAKRLHLFAFRTDLTGFRHLHPTMNESGEWGLRLPALAPAPYRVVAEFQPKGRATSILLGSRLALGEQHSAKPLPPPATTTNVDGYTVALSDVSMGGQVPGLAVTIRSKNGAPAVLTPYLDSWAHAVLVHADTLAVKHLHPFETYATGAASPERLTLAAAVGEPGDYRLIVEFATRTGVHQAEFTIAAI